MKLLTLKSVLVAIDLGESSRYPLITAARLAGLAGASLHVLHILEGDTQVDEARLKEHFRRVVPDAREPDSVRILPGSAADVIVEHAARVNADVVVLGPHRGLGEDGSLGGTASRVVSLATCPCLVAATELRLPLERVLVPVDVSSVTEIALSVAVTWASALRTRGGEPDVAVFHVSNEITDGAGGAAALEDAVERARADAGSVAHVAIRQLTIAGPDTARQILEQAGAMPADLMVLGTGAGNAMSVLGGVSTAIARNTPCPLLLVSSRMRGAARP